MGSRSLGELLLRPTSLSRISFAQPATFNKVVPSWTARRTITNSPASNSAQPQRKDEDPVDTFDPPSPQAGRPQNQPPEMTAESNTGRNTNAMDGLFSSMSRPTYNQNSVKQTGDAFGGLFSNTSSPQAGQSQNQPSDAERMGERIDGLFSSMSHPTYNRPGAPTSQQDRARNIFGSNFSNQPGGVRRRVAMLDFDSMDGLPIVPQNKPVMQLEPEKQTFPRLNPAFGRTVELDASKGRDIVRGINMLASLTARNKVKADFNKQRFHERPGLRRKRLNSERWRARFKKGFTEVTARVSELTRKGW